MASSHASGSRARPSQTLPLWTLAIILPLATLALLGILRATQPSLLSLALCPPGLDGKGNAGSVPDDDVGAAAGHRMDGGSSSRLLLQAIRNRRAWYALDKSLGPAGGEVRVSEILQDALQAVPSAFNSQSNRAVLLLGHEHDRAWDIIAGVLRAHVSSHQWPLTEKKLAGFKAAAGTVLFFIDKSVIESYAADIPAYAASFPVWAAQSDAMLQFAVWTALSTEGLGANLQHYNPLVNTALAEAWNLPSTWQLTAQLVFGGRIGETPAPKDKRPVWEKLRVYGSPGDAR